MVTLHEKYEIQNVYQELDKQDPFTIERYEQFFKLFSKTTKKVLDVGCNTGVGGLRLKELDPSLEIVGLDCDQEKLSALPPCYSHQIYGLSTDMPIEDRAMDTVVAGEFIEHLYPADVDKTLCEFQRVLKIGGRLLLSTPNPNYIKNKVDNATVYGRSHLTQHFPGILKTRLQMHGFSKVRICGSGRLSRYLGYRFPLLSMYGSYIVVADKY